MRHARADYERFQDPLGLIPEDEPVFLIRGKDVAAVQAVNAYANIAEEKGADDDLVRVCRDWAVHIAGWQAKNGAKIPDL